MSGAASRITRAIPSRSPLPARMLNVITLSSMGCEAPPSCSWAAGGEQEMRAESTATAKVRRMVFPEPEMRFDRVRGYFYVQSSCRLARCRTSRDLRRLRGRNLLLSFMTNTLADLELLMKSRQGLIVLDTVEEDRVLTLLRLLADRLTLPLFLWSRTKGLRRDGNDNAVYGTADPAQALAHIGSSTVQALYYLSGAGPLLQDSGLAEHLRDVATQLSRQPGAIVLSGVALELPEGLRRLSATVKLPAPDAAEFRRLLQRILRDMKRDPSAVQLTTEEENRRLEGLRGLTLLEAEKVLTRAIVEDGRLTADDIAHVIRAKKEIVEREGVLEYYPAEEALGEVIGLAGLKDWLAKRTHIVRSPKKAAEFGLTFPRGLLLIGVPGCGKSLSARAVANEWGLPLLRMDPGALYNKYIGETEKNFRRACDVAERVAPCVLFIDEIEKAFAGNGSSED